MCGKAECRVLHRQKTQAQWRRRNRGYAIAYRIDQRATQTESPAEPMRVPAPLDRLPSAGVGLAQSVILRVFAPAVPRCGDV